MTIAARLRSKNGQTRHQARMMERVNADLHETCGVDLPGEQRRQAVAHVSALPPKRESRCPAAPATSLEDVRIAANPLDRCK